LGGQTFYIAESDIRIGENDFSIFYKQRSSKQSVYLGPAAYINHDCESNATFRSIGEPTYVNVSTIKSILPGEEITVNYGDNYFGLGNTDCACLTCENQTRGKFKKQGIITYFS